MTEHGIEGGFGSGLRAKLERKDEVEPRSPGEAIAAAVSVDNSDVEALRLELSASLSREQELRASLTEQVEVSGREVQVEQELAQQSAALDRRASALAATEAELEERERKMTQRLIELDGLLELEGAARWSEAKLAEREQLIDLKVHELKTADEERAVRREGAEGEGRRPRQAGEGPGPFRGARVQRPAGDRGATREADARTHRE